MINYKQILEVVNRGIKFALDDYEDQDDIQGQVNSKVKNTSNLKEYFKWQQLIDKLENKELTKQDINELSKLSKLLNLKYTVNSKDELKVITKYIIRRIDSNANLNWIDTSKITNMDFLFINSVFNGDISEWDVSNVESMYSMFTGSDFDGDISKWDVSKVADMRYMFQGCPFNHDISMWDVWRANKDDIVKTGIFNQCPINLEYRPKFNNE